MNVDVLMLASVLEPGETVRELCPRCNGGSTQERSLTITLDIDGGVVWNCFRDKCEERGRSGGTYLPRERTTETKKVHRTFNGNTEPLSEHRLKIINSKWGIRQPPYWYWTPDYGGRVAMSIRSPKFMHRGWVLRDIRGVARAKALTYLEEGEVQQSWYRVNRNRSAPCVVVEDMPSAVRVSMCGVNAVGLLGTILNIEKAQEIEQYSGHVVIALDQDATDKGFQIARKWGLLWGSVQVLPLEKDFKDMTDEEIHQKLGQIYERKTCTI